MNVMNLLEDLSCTFHHLGIACRDLDAETAPWLALGYHAEGPDFEDPIQKVRGRFLLGAGPRLELLAALTTESPIDGMLKRGTKIYHQAFVTTRFDEAVTALRASDGKLVAGPVAAEAFERRRIAFIALPNMNVIELIEGRGL